MNEDKFDELKEPLVLSTYLDEEDGILTPEFLVELVERGDPKSEDKFRHRLRKAWGQGRSHGEVKEYYLVFDDDRNGITNKVIAQRLHVTSAAVGSWFNESRGVEPENLELLRRYYRELLSVASPTNHEMDLSGFVRAVSVMRSLRDAQRRRLDEMDFFRLWFLYRNETWRAAVEKESVKLKRIALSEINRKVKRVAMGLSVLRLERRRKYLSDPESNDIGNVDVSLARLEELAQSWGPSFVASVMYLDEICWTRPHDA